MCIFVLPFFFAAPPSPVYVLEVMREQRVQATLSYDISAEKQKAKEWIVFAPAAPELPGQTSVQSTMSPRSTILREAGDGGRSLMRARVPVTGGKQQQHLDVRVTYTATLNSRHLRRLNENENRRNAPAISAADRKRHLEARGDFDFNAEPFRKWLADEKLTRGAIEGEIDYARRVFQLIQAKGKYEYTGEGECRASAVCRSMKSDCGGFSVLFASALRANGIPARTLFGRWAKSADPNEKLNGLAYLQWHVKSEFYASGIGWVPVDMSLALDDKSPDRLAYFGHDDGDFLVQHIDSNIEIDTVHFGKETIHNLQTPAWWSIGEGSADPWTAKENWEVKVLK